MAGGEDAQRTRCMVEIRAGTGGDEAALFARDLYEMYRRYCESKGWKVEVMDMSPTELGGFKEVILGLEGDAVFRGMQYENGGHRVQRMPETETKGRVHTSAATVAVMAEPEDVEIDLKPSDYKVERYARSSGPGGQNVNKTASAIRLTHAATGLEVCCQDESSQHKNLSKALRVLKSRLYELKREEEQKKRSTERREKIGSGDRNERIRTYNFPQNRLTDHRINQNFNLENVIAGNLAPVVDALIECDRQAARAREHVLGQYSIEAPDDVLRCSLDRRPAVAVDGRLSQAARVPTRRGWTPKYSLRKPSAASGSSFIPPLKRCPARRSGRHFASLSSNGPKGRRWPISSAGGSFIR